MTDRRIRLIHSKEPSSSVEIARHEWGFENARQLGLFDDFDKLNLIVVPMAEVSAHSFVRALDERRPQVIVDARAFPDFFSVYESTAQALALFKARGVLYIHIPINLKSPKEELWDQFSRFRESLEERNTGKTNAPILMLTSTVGSSAALISRLHGAVLHGLDFLALSEFSG